MQGGVLQDQMLRSYIDQIFIKYDTDGNGELDVQQMTRFFNDLFKSIQCDIVVTEQQSFEAIKSIDANSDGMVDRSELFNAFKMLLNKPSQPQTGYNQPYQGNQYQQNQFQNNPYQLNNSYQYQNGQYSPNSHQNSYLQGGGMGYSNSGPSNCYNNNGYSNGGYNNGIYSNRSFDNSGYGNSGYSNSYNQANGGSWGYGTGYGNRPGGFSSTPSNPYQYNQYGSNYQHQG